MSTTYEASNRAAEADQSIERQMTPPGSPYPHSGGHSSSKDDGVKSSVDKRDDASSGGSQDQERSGEGRNNDGAERSHRDEDKRGSDEGQIKRDGHRGPNRNFSDRNPPSPSAVLAFFNLGRDIKKSSLQEWVEMFAPVQNVDIILDRFDVPKGFAFVTFNSIDDATSVMESLHNKELNGRPIRVTYSATAQPFDKTPGRYHGKPAREPRYRSGPLDRDQRDDRDYRREDRGYRGGSRDPYDRDRRYDPRDYRDYRDSRDSRDSRGYRDSRDSRGRGYDDRRDDGYYRR